MNSALQCLAHTTPLTRLILSPPHVLTPEVGGAAELAGAYGSLLRLMRGEGGGGEEDGGVVASPAAFKEILIKQLPQFDGTGQHDSQEFLNGLLSCLDEEFCELAKRAQAVAHPPNEFKVPSTAQFLPQPPLHSEIGDLFLGSLRNVVHCSSCSGEFPKPDEFMCLPVPLPLTETTSLRVHVIDKSSHENVQYGIVLPFWASIGDVLEKLVDLVELAGTPRIAVVSGQRVRRILSSSHSVSSISAGEDLFAFGVELECDADALAPPVRPEALQELMTTLAETEARGGNVQMASETEPDAEPDSEPACISIRQARSLSMDVAEIAGVSRERARAACDASGQDGNAAVIHLLEVAEQPVAEFASSAGAIALPESHTAPPDSTPLALPSSDVDMGAIALPPPDSMQMTYVAPVVSCAIALPPAAVATVAPAESITSAPMQALPALIGPQRRPVTEEDVQQVACVCGVTEDVARQALKRTYGDMDRAVGMVFENPEAIMSSSDSVLHDAAPRCLKRSNSDPFTLRADSATNKEFVTPTKGSNGSGERARSADKAPPVSTTNTQGGLAEAAARADALQIKTAIDGGADVHAVDIAGPSLLHAVLSTVIFDRIREKTASALRVLLEARADPGQVDESGQNVAHHLARCGADSLLRDLHVAKSLQLEVCDKSGQTMLHKCAASGHGSTVALLLSWGAQPDVQDSHGQTPVAIATDKGREDALDELLQRPRLVAVAQRVLRAGETGTPPQAGAIESAKEAGNKLLKAGNFPSAIEQYTLGINSASDGSSDIVGDCYNNRAAAHWQLRNYENVVADTTECLLRCPDNGKALVRRAQAYVQLEKLKAALADVTAALKGGTLNADYTQRARNVHKEICSLLRQDGIHVDELDLSGHPPSVGAGVSNRPKCRYDFVGSPFILALPRTRAVSGSELYVLAWRRATCGRESPSTWSFALKAVARDAEDDGRLIPCDSFAAVLPERDATLAMEWLGAAAPAPAASPPRLHSSAEALTKEEGKGVSLQECLDTLVEERKLTGDDMWYCPICEQLREVTLRTAVERLPQMLVLHLKRFYYTRARRGKISALVQFPTECLDFAPWCESTKDSSLYDLYGVVNHYGGFGSGHYTAFARPSCPADGNDGAEGSWYEFNDRACSRVLPDQLVTRAAYLLFYRRRD